MKPEPAESRKPVRSYVLRPGRMTSGQRAALETHWQHYGLEVADGVVDYLRAFGRSAPAVLEIGFGMGDSLLEMAQQRPEVDFIGVEVHPPGVGRLLMACDEQGVENVRVYRHDAVEVLDRCIADDSLAGIQVYFPDPWPKKKHHKRRLIQAPLVATLAHKLAPGGYLHLATDWQPYSEQMLDLLESQEGLRNLAGCGHYAQRPQWRPRTKFERRGERLGHGVSDLLFEKLGKIE